MIASILHLTRTDIKALRITDAYSLHRVVYSLYEDIRSENEKYASVPSGILYADKGGDWNSRKILMLANRLPHCPQYGHLETKQIPDTFLQHKYYGFKVIINPSKREKITGKTVAVRGHEAISQWFIDKAPQSWGFSVTPERLQLQNLGVKTFKKSSSTITHNSATLQGELTVIDRECFINSFRLGIGRGRAFGFGLLQIVPLLNPFHSKHKENHDEC